MQQESIFLFISELFGDLNLLQNYTLGNYWEQKVKKLTLFLVFQLLFFFLQSWHLTLVILELYRRLLNLLILMNNCVRSGLYELCHDWNKMF